MTFQRNNEFILNTIVTLGTCSPIKDAIVISCDNETDVIRKWMEILYYTDPDILTGYNICYFDMKYIVDRAKELGLVKLSEDGKRIIGGELLDGDLEDEW